MNVLKGNAVEFFAGLYDALSETGGANVRGTISEKSEDGSEPEIPILHVSVTVGTEDIPLVEAAIAKAVGDDDEDDDEETAYDRLDTAARQAVGKLEFLRRNMHHMSGEDRGSFIEEIEAILNGGLE